MRSIHRGKLGLEPAHLLGRGTQLVPLRYGCRQALLEIFDGFEVPLDVRLDPLRPFEISFENGDSCRRLAVVGPESGEFAIGRAEPGPQVVEICTESIDLVFSLAKRDHAAIEPLRGRRGSPCSLPFPDPQRVDGSACCPQLTSKFDSRTPRATSAVAGPEPEE